ncbi:MAG TPA: decaprenyl-phosphate phosphoribosyltransferase [Blastocatellia bacterium]|nr:decaprenyl-phosphate phosphoribosyltransferase [Blastocatellia bacterium]
MESLNAKTVVPRDRRVSRNFTAALVGLLVSLRPHQWVKNLLLFSGLIFSGSLLKFELAARAASGFIIFCLASSGIYLVNDLRDLQSDRQHLVKRHRPLAAGRVKVPAALAAMLVLLGAAMIGAVRLGQPFTLLLSVYVLVNIAYSFGLKYVVILDVILVASGFVLRAVAGAVVISVAPSHWLILCTMMLAMLVVSGKRRHDVVAAGDGAPDPDREWYSVQFLDLMMAISGGTAVVTYALYTLSPETVARIGTHGMILTVPFVMYGIFRYLYLMHRQAGTGDPALLFLTDRAILVNSLLWVAMVCLVLYEPQRLIDWLR